MNKKRLATIGSAALGITIATGITSAYAAENFQPFFASEENRESLEQSIENNDYQTWSSLMAAQGDYIQEQVQEFNTEETFNMIQEAEELAESGDLQAAKELLNEAGIPPMMTGAKGKRGGRGHGKGMHMDSEQREAIQEALTNEDYAAWVEAVSATEGRISEHTDEEHFEHMLEVQDLMESGDTEAARELKKEFRDSMKADGETNEGSEA